MKSLKLLSPVGRDHPNSARLRAVQLHVDDLQAALHIYAFLCQEDGERLPPA